MDILDGGLVGRPAEEIGKLFDVADILVLSLGAEPADRHVLDQSPAYRADGLVGHWGLLSWVRFLAPQSQDRTPCFCHSPRPFPCHKLPRERFSPSAHPFRSRSLRRRPAATRWPRSALCSRSLTMRRIGRGCPEGGIRFAYGHPGRQNK